MKTTSAGQNVVTQSIGPLKTLDGPPHVQCLRHLRDQNTRLGPTKFGAQCYTLLSREFSQNS